MKKFLKGLFIAVFAFVCLTAFIGLRSEAGETDKNVSSFTVVIDAGHGGIDGGVIGKITKVKESELNLAVTFELQKCFENAGIKTVLTRSSSGGLYGLPTTGFKKRDMQKRKEIITGSNADVVISIHMNYYSSSLRRGAQVFFKQGSEQSRLLASCMQENLNNMKEASRNCEILKGDYYVLNVAEASAVLVECGFLSNPEDEALLTNKEYQAEIAYTIFRGVIEYFIKVT